MVLGALETKIVWTFSRARFFQDVDFQQSVILQAKNHRDKPPWGLDKAVFGLVFAVILLDNFKIQTS